jgi:hypothetical protein
MTRSSPLLGRAAGLLARYSVDILRISLGIVFGVFGALKFVPERARPSRWSSAPSIRCRSASCPARAL